MPEMTSIGDFHVNAVAGLIEPAERIASPNCDSRPEGAVPELLVLHGISLPPGRYGGPEIEALFCNRLEWEAHPYFAEICGLRVSAHALVRRDGHVQQFVPFTERAWHAGVSQYRGRDCCNDFSIGIEIEGSDDEPYDDRQYAVLGALVDAVCRAYPAIGLREVLGHCDIAPGRKTDPGPAFDWIRLYDAVCSRRDTGPGAL